MSDVHGSDRCSCWLQIHYNAAATYIERNLYSGSRDEVVSSWRRCHTWIWRETGLGNSISRGLPCAHAAANTELQPISEIHTILFLRHRKHYIVALYTPETQYFHRFVGRAHRTHSVTTTEKLHLKLQQTPGVQEQSIVQILRGIPPLCSWICSQRWHVEVLGTVCLPGSNGLYLCFLPFAVEIGFWEWQA